MRGPDARPVSEDAMPPPPRSRLRALELWIVGHAPQIWPAIVVVAVAALSWHVIGSLEPRRIAAAMGGIDRRWIAAAMLVTALNVAVMGLYDVVVLARAGIPRRDRWLFGAIAFAWSNFLTLGPLAGPAVRLWLYRTADVPAAALHAGIAQIAIGFAGGLAAWVVAALLPLGSGASGMVAQAACAVAIATVAGLALHLAQARLARRWEWAATPAPWVRLLLVGVCDWALAAAAFAICLASARVPIGARTLHAFFLGQAIGVASLIPGGFGSADAFWLATLRGRHDLRAVALLVYRGVYYALPWATASFALLGLAVRRGARWAAVGRVALAALAGIAGFVLIASTASPALEHRLVLLEQRVPVHVVEASHLATALLGILLLVLARGLSRGYRVAHRLTVAAAVLGAGTAILKGLDFEEALLLCVVAGLVASQAPLFRRPSHGDWIGWPGAAVVVAAVFVFAGIGFATHDTASLGAGDVWVFAHGAQASRFVRAVAFLGLGALAVLLWVGLRVPTRFRAPDPVEVARALAVHHRLGGASTFLSVANFDKSILLEDDVGACLYRTVGPYLVVFSDPVVVPGRERRLLEAVLARAHELDRRATFYQISSQWIPALHDLGYRLFKLGEEAHVDLASFSLAGGAHKALRQMVARIERSGARFEVVPPEAVAPLLPELHRVSDAWLAAKDATEKQFSIGFFHDGYLTTFPMAIVRAADGPIVAFANLLPAATGGELSVDLMRFAPDAHPGAMDFLLVRLFEWGRAHGYADFNLGMAPLATVGEARTAHFPERLARILFRYGESWYNFRGLREYKSKFQPRWQPRYLAYSRTWEWPRLVAHVSALIAGGWRTVAHLPARDDASGHAGAGVDRVSTVADASLELALETTTGSSAAGATRAERGGLAR